MSNYLFSTSFLKNPHRLSSKRSSGRSGIAYKPYQMSYFTAALAATVLEDTISQFRINMNTSNEWRVAQAISEMDQLVAIKFNVERPVVTDELANVDIQKLDSDEYKLNKMFIDRYYFRDVLEDTYASLCISQNYCILYDYVREIAEKKAYRTFVLQDETDNRLLRKDLMRQIRQLRNHIKSATYDANCTIAELRTSVESVQILSTENLQDAALNAEIRGRYVTNWQVARTEQNHQLIKDKETKVSQSIENFKERYDQEQRIHSEIDLLVNINLNEILQKIETWMVKYDEDIEAVDLKIQIMKNNYVQQKEKRENLEKKIADHDKQMKDWIKFKKDREEARRYSEKMTNAAITVQAWWRGFLVRNQLGPYKPVKRRGAPAGGKKGKK